MLLPAGGCAGPSWAALAVVQQATGIPHSRGKPWDENIPLASPSVHSRAAVAALISVRRNRRKEGTRSEC